MPQQNATHSWHFVGGSVRGATHARFGKDNQDALHHSPDRLVSPTFTVAVADGHGGTRYCRSKRGAELAVESAIEVLEGFCHNQSSSNLSVIKRLAEEQLPNELTRQWRDKVNTDIQNNPLTSEETDLLRKDKAKALDKVVAYGTTLIAVVVEREYLLCLQIGDGDILTVFEDGAVRRPFVKDERFLGNETISLCSKNAWHEFRVSFYTDDSTFPKLLLVASDGYTNSFLTEDGFLQVGSDLLQVVRENGIDAIRSNLLVWLEEASQQGSGDDITVAILYRDLDTTEPTSVPEDQLQSQEQSKTNPAAEKASEEDDEVVLHSNPQQQPQEETIIAPIKPAQLVSDSASPVAEKTNQVEETLSTLQHSESDPNETIHTDTNVPANLGAPEDSAGSTKNPNILLKKLTGFGTDSNSEENTAGAE